MTAPAEPETRDALRREAYDLKVALTDLSERLIAIEPEAAAAARRARLDAFETWTILATPIGDDDDHDH